MPIKTYGIYGKTAAKLDFRCGNARVTAEFTGGVPDQRTNRPATKTTDNTVAQFIIEHDPKFGSLVRLISDYPTAQEKAAKAAKEEKAAKAAKEEKTAKTAKEEGPVEGAVTERALTANVHDEVTNFNGAREVLMDLGATAKETLSKDACRATAARLNVAFPNWR